MKQDRIEGRISFEPDIKEKFASFKLSKSNKDRDGNRIYGAIRCIAFKDTIAAVREFTKGDIVVVTGDLRPAADWTTKEGTTKDGGWEFVIESIERAAIPEFDEEGRPRRQRPAAAPAPAPKAKLKMNEDSDCPF